MILIIYLLTITLCLIATFINLKSNTLKGVVIALFTYLMGRAAMTPDMFNYYLRYRDSEYSSIFDTYEPGYELLQVIGHYLGLDYIQFRFILIFISLILLGKSVNRLTGKQNFIFYFLYGLFFVFIDSTQIRSFIAFSIITYGITYLFTYKGFKALVLFIFFILIASSIHISSIVYLPLALIVIKKKKLLVYSIAFLTLIVCIIIYFGLLNISLVQDAIKLLTEDADRVQNYSGGVKLGFLYPFILHLSATIVLYLILINLVKEYSIYKAKNLPSEFYEHKIRLLNFFNFINILSIIYFPLYMFHVQFSRIARAIFLLNIIAYAAAFFKYRYLKYQKILIFIFGLAMISAWYNFTFVVENHIEDIIQPFFSEETFDFN